MTHTDQPVGRLRNLVRNHKSRIALVAVAIAVSLLVDARAGAEDGIDQVVAQWQFSKSRFDDKQFSPVVGKLTATPVGPVQFSEEEPRALKLRGDSQTGDRLSVTDDLAAANLPTAAISVEAWVMVDRPEKWGGIVSALQDNGDFERGWVLGFNESSFYFGLASAGRKRLTYLNAASFYQPGYWYHVVATYDGAEQRIYVDGQLQGRSTDQTGAIIYPPKGFFTIGAYRDDNELYSLAGRLEQVTLLSRALNEDEVRARFEDRKSQFPEIEPARIRTTDWPTYLRDNQRTGMADEPLAMPLKLAWRFQTRHPPQPAWPPPANQDFWHKQHGLKARVTYDHFLHLVSASDCVYFGSSADDQLYCLDAATGELRWRFFAEAPIRLAPTVADGRVIFGSDDGSVYCLDAADGRLLWRFRPDETERWIAGNGRIINQFPVRTGVLVEGNVAYFCAGIFPGQGVRQFAIDIRDGKEIASGSLDVSAQGYLERRAGRLFVATGRDPAGRFVSQLARRGKDIGKQARSIPADYPFAFVGAGDQRFGGGDQKVAAFDAKDGREIWSAEVEGRAGSMAVARGKLFVSTDQGCIYCFAPDVSATVIHDAPALPDPPLDSAAYSRMLDVMGCNRGYGLVIGGATDGALSNLLKRSKLRIVWLETDHEATDRARQNLFDAGFYGRVVVRHVESLASLPFTDYLFNVIIIDGTFPRESLTKDVEAELQRVLRPGGAMLNGFSPDIRQYRAKLQDVGEWTHLYGDPSNTSCSGDPLIRGAMRIQWFGGPGPQPMIDRHHRTVSPLSKGGCMFVPGDNRVIAVDAYNGTTLWDVEVPNSRRVGVMRDCGSMAAADDTLYVAAGGSCWALDVKNGERRRTIDVPAAPDGQPRDWGYTACVDDLLFGSATVPNASRRGHSLATIREGTFWDFRPVVTSDAFFAVKRAEEKPSWQYRPESGAIINPSITIGGERVYFVETTGEAPTSGRVFLHKEFQQPVKLVALASESGEVVWRREIDLSAIQHNIFGLYADEILVLAGSRNDGTDKKRSRVWYDLTAFDARTGEKIWSQSQNNRTEIGGDHGEQDHHPVIVGDRIYAEPYAYELKTGKPLDWGWNRGHRRGCGTMSASACAFFFRDANPSMFDLESRTTSNVTQVTRPGCWINMIPAGGLLLIPEASSGCTCDFAVQTSMAFVPVEPTRDNRKTP